MIEKIYDNDFSRVIDEEVAVVDFSATWCNPCRMLEPVLEEVSEQMDDIAFYNADVDENGSIAAKYGISSIPCVIMLKGGEEIARTVGFLPKAQLEAWINSAL